MKISLNSFLTLAMDGGELSGSRSGRITFKASTTDAS
jgi:hypothetical protein